MINFSALVLGPAMGVFGQPIVFTPTASQPGAAPFTARGIYAVKQVTVRTDDGIFTDQQPTLGIRIGPAPDFPVMPEQGDSFVLNGTTWNVFDWQPDGQGGVDLVLKQD